MTKRIRFTVAVAMAATFVALNAFAAAPATKTTPSRVVILATGGTIAGVQPKEGDPGYKSGSLSVESLIQAAPGVEKLARLEGEQIASIGSQDMNDEVWFKLARRANAVLAEPDVIGIVVTHGTDTLEETAYFLDLVLKSDKPVVLVGSMRPATSTSPDGPLNLYNAVSVAADPAAKGLGVVAVANDDVHSARAVQKTNTTDVQTFVSASRGLIGEAYYGKNRFFNRPTDKHTTKSEFSIEGLTSLPRVEILYAEEGVDGALVQAAVAAGAKGIVLAGVGDGNATKRPRSRASWWSAARGSEAASCAATSSSTTISSDSSPAWIWARRRPACCCAWR
jgi:L-asparaginase